VQFLNSEEGAMAVEYALVAAVLSVAILVGILVLTDELGGLYGGTTQHVGGAVDHAGAP